MEDKGKDVLFGKSMFGGFRRGDVIRFIDSLQKQHMRDTQGGEESLRQAHAQMRQLRQQLDEANARITQLEAQIRSLEESKAQADISACAEKDAQESPELPAGTPMPPEQPADTSVQPAPRQDVQNGFFVETQGGTKKPSPFSRKGRALNRFF